MRFWARLGLIAWLLTGLMSAPAMAFGMTCHGGIDGPDGMAMAQAMPHGMAMTHTSVPHTDKDMKLGKDMQHRAFACAVHCLSAGTGFILPPSDNTKPAMTGMVRAFFRPAPLMGLIVGPPLEPPIPTLV